MVDVADGSDVDMGFVPLELASGCPDGERAAVAGGGCDDGSGGGENGRRVSDERGGGED